MEGKLGAFYDAIEKDLALLDQMSAANHGARPVFGADYDSDAATVARVQTLVNAAGYQPQLTVDGIYGPMTKAGVQWLQAQRGLTADGIIGDQTLQALGIATPSAATQSKAPAVSVSTVVAALKQAANEMGYSLSDNLASLMIGQLRGAETAMPGITYGGLQGTNNYGGATVVESLQAAKMGVMGWGAYAHKDTNPNARTPYNPDGGYLSFFWIAPSALEGARYWLGGNWWGKALLDGNPQDATSYASILYRGQYFLGAHADPDHDPNSPGGSQNVADYAANVQAHRATAAELAEPPDDPSKITVAPQAFPSLAQRGITEALYNLAMSGGLGSQNAWLLPSTWAEFAKNNGVVWFGPPPSTSTVVDSMRIVMQSAAANPKRTVGIVAAVVTVVGTALAFALRRG